jgi:hypothetical protein
MVRGVEHVLRYSSRLMYELANGYSIEVLGRDCIVTPEEGGGFRARVPSLPGCRAEGRDLEQVRKNLAEAIGLYLGPDPLRTPSNR